MIPKITQEKLNVIAHKAAQDLLNSVQQLLSKPEYQNSGELRESLAIKVTPATDNEAPLIVMTYADQGFYIGYKSPQWVKLPNIEKLTKWANLKSFDLSDIPGYEYGNAPALSVEKQKERIIWAIAKNKRKEDTWKQKKWKKAAGLSQLLKQLNQDTTSAYVRDIETILAQALSEGAVMS